MWYTLMKKGYAGMRKDVEKCLRNAHLLKGMFEEHGIQCMLNELSSTVVFERPAELEFVRKWQLACCDDIAHVVVMPNVSPEKLRKFVDEYLESRARVGQTSPPGGLKGVQGNAAMKSVRSAHNVAKPAKPANGTTETTSSSDEE